MRKRWPLTVIPIGALLVACGSSNTLPTVQPYTPSQTPSQIMLNVTCTIGYNGFSVNGSEFTPGIPPVGSDDKLIARIDASNNNSFNVSVDRFNVIYYNNQSETGSGTIYMNQIIGPNQSLYAYSTEYLPSGTTSCNGLNWLEG